MSSDATASSPAEPGHSRWVRCTHGIVTVRFLLLAFTGVTILRCHPRLYWGEVGNDLTQAWMELPISKNYRHGGWEGSAPFFDTPGSPVSASRTFDIFNQNSWGRSLHFLAAWFLLLTGIAYLLAGMLTGHFRRSILPRFAEMSARSLWQDAQEHLRRKIRAPTGGPQYGILQKCTYAAVVFLALPLVGVTGLAMSPP